MRWQSVTPLPNAPALIEGVIDLRGAVVPVVDLGRALGGAAVAPGRRTRIAVTEVDGLVMGLAVDAAVEVLSVDVGHLDDPPMLATQTGYDMTRAVVRRAGRRADPRAVARARAGERVSLGALGAGGRRMTQSALPTGRGLMLRMHLLTCLVPLPALGVLLACLFTLLELTHEQWMWFLAAVGLYTAVFTGPIMLYQRRTVAAIVDMARPPARARPRAGDDAGRLRREHALPAARRRDRHAELAAADVDHLPRDGAALGALEPVRLRRGPVLRARGGLSRRDLPAAAVQAA